MSARLLVLVVLLYGAAAAQTLRYTVLSNSVATGSEVDTYHADGSIDSTYEYNDRGRGPKVTAHYAIRGDGLPIGTDIKGNDYWKAPVDEHFFLENGEAHWHSTSENGKSAPGFYLSVNGPPAEMALLVAMLIKAKGAPVHLLPAGEASLERLADTTLEDHGQKLHVTEYAISGLSFEPQMVWLDDNLRFFGSPGPWAAILAAGWESVNGKLYALDRAAEDARNARLARQLAQHLATSLAIEHVRVFDSEQAAIRDDQTVVISGERIAAAGPAAAIQVPKDARRIDGSGKTLLPGLFDMHVHAEAVDGLLHIANGVTSVRDMGNDIDELAHLQERWQRGETIGPRVWRAGFIDGRGPFQAPTGLYADTPEEALAAVNRYAGLGFIQIKVYSSLRPDLLPGIVQTAHAHGLRVSGHIPNGMIASQFVEAGADEIQHINFIFLNFLANQVKDTRGPERFTAVGAQAAKLDLNSKPVSDFINLLLRRHTTVDVTMAAFEGMFTGRPGQVSPDYAPVVRRLPAQVQRGAYTGGLAVTPDTDQLYRDSWRAMLRMTKRMYDAGVPILAGTDALAGFMLHRELELEVEAGIPPAKALQIATINAARLLKQDRELGSITAGKLADFVLVDGNPAERIADIRHCRLVAKAGVLYNSADVDRMIGVKPE